MESGEFLQPKPDSSFGKGASLRAQLVKNPPAMQETLVQFLGSGRSAGEWIGYPLQYSWASLVAWLVKNPPAMQETRIRSLGWEDLLEKGKATHSSTLAWRIPCTIQSMGSQRVGYNQATFIRVTECCRTPNSCTVCILHLAVKVGRPMQ